MSSPRSGVVLVIEDEVDLCDMYRASLESEYDVRVATNGQEGLEKLDETVDVVLLDRRMPGLSGDEVLERIRDRPVDCRVVMVTAVDPDASLLDMEFDDYLVKPTRGPELVEAVERMIARNELDDRIQEMVRLSGRLATLEMKLDIDQLERSQKYQSLLDRLNTLRDEVELPEAEDDYYSDATLQKLRTLIEKAQ
ncbi:MAG: response regulator transcription factor [Salinirussus sp.]